MAATSTTATIAGVASPTAAATTITPPPIPSRATKPPSPRTTPFVTVTTGGGGGAASAGAAAKLHPSPNAGGSNSTAAVTGSKPPPAGAGAHKSPSNAIFPFLPQFTHFSFPHSSPAAGSTTGAAASSSTLSNRTASTSQPPSPGGGSGYQHKFTAPVIVVPTGMGAVSRSLPPSRSTSPERIRARLLAAAAAGAPSNSTLASNGAGPRRASLYVDDDDDDDDADGNDAGASDVDDAAMRRAAAAAHAADATAANNSATPTEGLWVMTPVTPAHAPHTTANDTNDTDPQHVRQSPQTGARHITPPNSQSGKSAKPATEPYPSHGSSSNSSAANSKHPSHPSTPERRNSIDGTRPGGTSGSAAGAMRGGSHVPQLPLYKPTHSTSNPNTPLANTSTSAAAASSGAGPSAVADWNALSHVEVIHRQGVRPPPCVAELCTGDADLAGRAYFRLFVPQTRADQKDEFVCCRKKTSQPKFRFSLDPNRLTKKNNPAYIGKMNLKTITVESLSTAAAAATATAQPAGATGGVQSPVAPSKSDHSHESSGDVVHVYTIALRSGTHVAEIRIRPPASYDTGKPTHVTYTLLNDFLNFHETGKAGRVMTGLVHSFMQPLLSLAVQPSASKSSSATGNSGTGIIPPRTVLQIHKPSDELRVWSPYSVPTSNPLHPSHHASSQSQSHPSPSLHPSSAAVVATGSTAKSKGAAASVMPSPSASPLVLASPSLSSPSPQPSTPGAVLHVPSSHHSAPVVPLNSNTRIGAATAATAGAAAIVPTPTTTGSVISSAPPPAAAAAVPAAMMMPIPESSKYVLDFDYPLTMFLSFALLCALEYHRLHDSVPF